MDTLSFWKEKLKEKGIRSTKQRSVILEVLLETRRPVSAQEIFSKIKDEDSRIRLSTIYRNLNQFENHGLVNRLNIDDKENRFELISEEHHHHLICVECGEILPLDCPLKDYEDRLGRETNYNILDHKLKIYGVCPLCQ